MQRDAAEQQGERPTLRRRTTREGTCELLESSAAIIILKEEYKQDLRKTLQMAGAEAM